MTSSNPIASTIILIFGIQSIVLIVLLLRKRPVGQSYIFLAMLLFFFILMSINIAMQNILVANGKIYLFKYFQLELLFGIGPSLYLFTKSITDPNFRISRKGYIHFIPVVLEFIYFRSGIYRIGFDRRMVIYQHHSSIYQSPIDSYTILYLILQWIAIASILVYIYLSVRLLIRYNYWIRTKYSNLKNKSLGWLQIPVFFYSGFWVVWIILRSLDTFIFQNAFKEIYFLPSFIGISITTCWIGFKGYVTSQTNATGFLASAVKHRLQNSNPGEAEKIIRYMESHKPYLNPDLDLAKLSELVSMNPKVTSHLINHDLNTNFYEFVNKYRVNEFKYRIEQDDGCKYSLLGLAYDCGFNSKSTFNYIFKKFTGQTPTEYSKQYKNKSERKLSDVEKA
jgi:AraC-like DNA-binding protein